MNDVFRRDAPPRGNAKGGTEGGIVCCSLTALTTACIGVGCEENVFS